MPKKHYTDDNINTMLNTYSEHLVSHLRHIIRELYELYLHGSIPFRVLSEVLGVSDQSIRAITHDAPLKLDFIHLLAKEHEAIDFTVNAEMDSYEESE